MALAAHVCTRSRPGRTLRALGTEQEQHDPIVDSPASSTTPEVLCHWAFFRKLPGGYRETTTIGHSEGYGASSA
jgi:hypothetical protein